MSRTAWLWLKEEQFRLLKERRVKMSLADVLDTVLAPLMAEGVGAKVQDLQANPNRQDAPDSVINQAPTQAHDVKPSMDATLDTATTETQSLYDEIRGLIAELRDEIGKTREARERDQRPAAPRKKPAKKRVKGETA